MSMIYIVEVDVLHNLALFDNALDLGDEKRTDAHFHRLDHRATPLDGERTLFSYQRIVAVVGVVGIAS